MLNCNCIERMKYAWKMILWMRFQVNCIFLSNHLFETEKAFHLHLFFLSANADCMNSQDETVVFCNQILVGCCFI